MEPRYYDRQVLPQELDFTRKAKFSSFCDKILNTVGEDAHVLGFGSDMLAERNMGWVLSELCLELDHSLCEYDTYKICTWVSEFNRLLSIRNFTLIDSTGNVFGKGTSRWCVIDYNLRRPVSLEIFGEKSTAVLTPLDPPCPLPARLKKFTPERSITHRVAYSDIDFNRHMNTMRYIDLMMDLLPLEYFETSRPLRMDIHFSVESAFGQNLTVGCSEDGPVNKFCIEKEDGTVSTLAHLTVL